MSTELKSCPFCGAGATIRLIPTRSDHLWVVSCSGCNASFVEDTRQAVIDLWNRRNAVTKATSRRTKLAKAKRKRLSDLVPMNWLDPMLSGPKAALPNKRFNKWFCCDIEALLRGIRDRIREAEGA